MGRDNSPAQQAANARYRAAHREELRERDRIYRLEHPEERALTRRKTNDKHREAKRERDRIAGALRRQRIRAQIFALLGNTCIRCGFADTRALQVDHINGGGNDDRRRSASVSSYYARVLASNGAGYQILCANCNQIKKMERGEHSTKRKPTPSPP